MVRADCPSFTSKSFIEGLGNGSTIDALNPVLECLIFKIEHEGVMLCALQLRGQTSRLKTQICIAT
ncbi:MAG: hypothetical protein LC723_13750 [Actinobacteria bacterium]|nr:hypothetical protein [Actinomycetota bacterium]